MTDSPSVVDTDPVGLNLSAADTGPDGIDVVVVKGECFGRRIRWYGETLMSVVVTTDRTTGLPLLRYRHKSGSGSIFEKRGFETANNTWWRYEEEANPASYREHCLRIVRKA